MAGGIRHILFDLDGTLVDTAPDMAEALNRVRGELGMPPVEYSKIRTAVSLGGRAMIKVAFDKTDKDPEFISIRDRFLNAYRENISSKSRLFDGMDQLLDALEDRGISWGIVTNKPAWLTGPLLDQMGLAGRTNCVVSGDTLPVAKPHPEPLLHACKLLGCTPDQAVYVGDAVRDVEAGISAGMATIIVRHGYFEEGTALEAWNADIIVDSPLEILEWLDNNSE